MSDVTKTCRDINELKPVAQVACNLFLAECKKAGIDIFITETYRSQERQNYLYAQGRTRPGNIVTWTTSSRHTSRLAWDIACNGDNLYDAETLTKAGEIAKKLGITWGGTWTKSPDRPHFEVTTAWKSPVTTSYRLVTDMFSTKSGAETAQAKIKALGYVVYLKQEGKKFYLMTGTFKTKEDATAARNKVKALGYIVFVKEA